MALFSIPQNRPSGAQIAGRAWASVFGATRRMPALAISALIALTVVTIGLSGLGFLVNAGVRANLHDPFPIAVFEFGWLQSALRICATSMIAAPVAVAMHRFILLGEVSRGAISIRSRRTLAFFVWVAGMQLITTAASRIADWLLLSNNIPVRNLAEYGVTVLAVEVPLIVATWIFLIYLALIFPALAIDEPAAGARARVSTSIGRMRGHFWQFVGAIVLTCAPVTVIGSVIGVALLRRMMEPMLGGRHGVWLALQNAWFYAQMVAGAFTSVLTVALAASIASWLYASISIEGADAQG